MLEIDVNPGEEITDSSYPQKKQEYKSKHTSFGTDASDEMAHPPKKAKFKDDTVASEPIAAYNADVEMKEGGTDLEPPADKIKHHKKLQARVGSKHVSTSGTSSSPTGNTSSSPTEKQESLSSSIDSSSSNKAKGKSPHSSDSGYRESNYSPEGSNDSSPSDTSNQKPPPEKRADWDPRSYVICLVRRDSSVIWCEVTASIRARSMSDESSESSSFEDQDELLLCFRPVTEGLPDSDITSSGNSGDSVVMRADGSNGSNGSNRSHQAQAPE
jgi:hypothetical protein